MSAPIAYSLLPAQIEFFHVQDLEVELDVCLYQGGYGSGKTFVGSLKGLALAHKYQGSRGLVCAKTYPLLRDTTLQTYFEHFDKFGWVQDTDYIWRASEQKLVFPHWGGSEILFRHLEKPFKLKSLNLMWIHIEEMSEIEESVFEILLSRLRQGPFTRHYLFGTSNPQAVRGWIYEYFVERNQGIQRVNDTVIHYRRIMAPSTENIHLSKAYLQNMASQYDREYYRINVLGQDGDYTAGLVVHSFSDLNIRSCPYDPELKIHLTCDFNVDPMSWYVVQEDNNETWVVENGEIVIENTNIDECVDVFCDRFPEHKAGIIINGDASGNSRNVQNKEVGGTSYTQMLNRFAAPRNGYDGKLKPRPRLDVREANPNIKDRVDAFNARVCNSEGIRRFFIDPSNKFLIKNCYNLHYKEGTGIIWEPTHNELKQDPKLKYVKHGFDAVSYYVEKYYPIRRKPRERKKEYKVPNLQLDI